MFLDPAVVALAVRTTARISAVLLATNLIVAARRLSAAPDSTLLPQSTQRTQTLSRLIPPRPRRPRRLFQARTLDTSTFAAFLVSHTIHFACVALLARATNGESMRDNLGGWTAAMIVAALFYLGGWAVLRAKQRPTHEWAGTRQRLREMGVLAIVWTVFFLAFLGRSTGSLLFGSLTIALVVSLGLFVVAGIRSPIARANSGKPQPV
jgi:hypothetical protein